ncbi:MAG: hypothetical protein L6Q54_05580 [Leptospiraceae bacterium]|nr:hypothetical protein [Leptospiraceae bacterium]MCK6380709.1 hypothetical protein [Leptospiraceae bacterium]NUM41247.1 hypothetical protein [Leptospiraceae bacterium]
MFDSLIDNFKKDEFSCHSKMLVKNFKTALKNALGIDVRVYIKNSNFPAKEDVTLASTRSDDFKGSAEEVSFKLSNTVQEVEGLFKSKMGIKIQILDKNNQLANNDMTIGALKRS